MIDEVEVGVITDCPKVAAYKGDVWEWFFYDPDEDPLLMVYRKIRDEEWPFYQDQQTELVGRLVPRDIKCDCGFVPGKSITHYDWCQTNTEDPWSD